MGPRIPTPDRTSRKPTEREPPEYRVRLHVFTLLWVSLENPGAAYGIVF
jgi:hypothetical protein